MDDDGFAEILKSEYIDKTGLIGLINNTISTKRKLTCISRPRRFGKSYAAKMLTAYYDRTCDSQDARHSASCTAEFENYTSDMSLSEKGICGMLEDYEADHETGMNTAVVARVIR